MGIRNSRLEFLSENGRHEMARHLSEFFVVMAAIMITFHTKKKLVVNRPGITALTKADWKIYPILRYTLLLLNH
jgi:hypothetical protein